jgi:hypothetical protein
MQHSRTKVIVFVTVAAGGAFLYYRFNPVGAGFFPKCPFYCLTGLYCPGCGSQRALHALLHGAVGQAAGYNLLAVMVLPVLAYTGLAPLATWLRGRPQGQSLLYRPWFTWSVLAATLIFWLLRNLPVPFFHWLAP